MALAAALVLAAPAIPIFHPRVDGPSRTDAVVVLGPSTDRRVRLGEDLVRRGQASALVVSAHPADLGGERPAVCDDRHVRYPVFCFDPVPATTQGEARAVRELARRHGWSSVRVVTFGPQLSRARLLVSRCYDGDVRMTDSGDSYDAAYMYLYQTGAFVKALGLPGC